MRIYFSKLECDSETCMCHWKWTDYLLITCSTAKAACVERPASSPHPQQNNSHFWNFSILIDSGRAILVLFIYVLRIHKTAQGKDQSTKVWLSNYHNLALFGNWNAHAADAPCLVYRKRWTLRKQHTLLAHRCKGSRRTITAVLSKPVWRPWRYFCSTHVKLKASEKETILAKPRSIRLDQKIPAADECFQQASSLVGLSASPVSLLTLAGCLADSLSCYVAISNCLDLLELTQVARPWRKG